MLERKNFKMTESAKIILIIGAILIAAAYVILYTPLAELLFVPKPKITKPGGIALQPSAIIPKAIPGSASPETLALPLSQEARIKIETPEAAQITIAKSLKASMEAFVPKYLNLRDPFDVGFSYAPLPAAVEEAAAGEASPKPQIKYLNLQGIFVSGDVRFAIIDDKLVSEGSETAGEYRILEIKQDRVILTKGRRIKTLRIRED